MRNLGLASIFLAPGALLSLAACGGDGDQGTPSRSRVFTKSEGFTTCDEYCGSISASCVEGRQVPIDHPCSSRIEWGPEFDSMLCSAFIYDRVDGTEDRSDGRGNTCTSTCSHDLWMLPERKSARCCCAQ